MDIPQLHAADSGLAEVEDQNPLADFRAGADFTFGRKGGKSPQNYGDTTKHIKEEGLSSSQQAGPGVGTDLSVGGNLIAKCSNSKKTLQELPLPPSARIEVPVTQPDSLEVAVEKTSGTKSAQDCKIKADSSGTMTQNVFQPPQLPTSTSNPDPVSSDIKPLLDQSETQQVVIVDSPLKQISKNQSFHTEVLSSEKAKPVGIQSTSRCHKTKSCEDLQAVGGVKDQTPAAAVKTSNTSDATTGQTEYPQKALQKLGRSSAEQHQENVFIQKEILMRNTETEAEGEGVNSFEITTLKIEPNSVLLETKPVSVPLQDPDSVYLLEPNTISSLEPKTDSVARQQPKPYFVTPMTPDSIATRELEPDSDSPVQQNRVAPREPDCLTVSLVKIKPNTTSSFQPEIDSLTSQELEPDNLATLQPDCACLPETEPGNVTIPDPKSVSVPKKQLDKVYLMEPEINSVVLLETTSYSVTSIGPDRVAQIEPKPDSFTILELHNASLLETKPKSVIQQNSAAPQEPDSVNLLELEPDTFSSPKPENESVASQSDCGTPVKYSNIVQIDSEIVNLLVPESVSPLTPEHDRLTTLQLDCASYIQTGSNSVFPLETQNDSIVLLEPEHERVSVLELNRDTPVQQNSVAQQKFSRVNFLEKESNTISSPKPQLDGDAPLKTGPHILSLQKPEVETDTSQDPVSIPMLAPKPDCVTLVKNDCFKAVKPSNDFHIYPKIDDFLKPDSIAHRQPELDRVTELELDSASPLETESDSVSPLEPQNYSTLVLETESDTSVQQTGVAPEKPNNIHLLGTKLNNSNLLVVEIDSVSPLQSDCRTEVKPSIPVQIHPANLLESDSVAPQEPEPDIATGLDLDSSSTVDTGSDCVASLDRDCVTLLRSESETVYEMKSDGVYSLKKELEKVSLIKPEINSDVLLKLDPHSVTRIKPESVVTLELESDSRTPIELDRVSILETEPESVVVPRFIQEPDRVNLLETEFNTTLSTEPEIHSNSSLQSDCDAPVKSSNVVQIRPDIANSLDRYNVAQRGEEHDSLTPLELDCAQQLEKGFNSVSPLEPQNHCIIGLQPEPNSVSELKPDSDSPVQQNRVYPIIFSPKPEPDSVPPLDPRCVAPLELKTDDSDKPIKKDCVATQKPEIYSVAMVKPGSGYSVKLDGVADMELDSTDPPKRESVPPLESELEQEHNSFSSIKPELHGYITPQDPFQDHPSGLKTLKESGKVSLCQDLEGAEIGGGGEENEVMSSGEDLGKERKLRLPPQVNQNQKSEHVQRKVPDTSVQPERRSSQQSEIGELKGPAADLRGQKPAGTKTPQTDKIQPQEDKTKANTTLKLNSATSTLKGCTVFETRPSKLEPPTKQEVFCGEVLRGREGPVLHGFSF